MEMFERIFVAREPMNCELRAEILQRAKLAGACKGEYEYAYKAKSTTELMKVIRDNITWAYTHEVITIGLIKEHEIDFNFGGIRANRGGKSGIIFCDRGHIVVGGHAIVIAHGDARVTAYDGAKVVAHENSEVTAKGSVVVDAFDNSTVCAYDFSIVRMHGRRRKIVAYDDATISAFCPVDCELHDRAICRNFETATVGYACSGIKIERV